MTNKTKKGEKLSAEQICKILHISKRKCAWMLQNGKIPCKDSGKKKRRYTVLRKDLDKVLCACDLLNEGWDCPQTEVLFMARPTMSKVLYTQQLGRGMRNCEGKDYLMVFDFVDNASQYNAPYSMSSPRQTPAQQ